MAPPSHLIEPLEAAIVKIKAAFEADWLDAGCPDDSDVLSEKTKEMFSIAMEPVSKYLDNAFWSYTTDQISGTVIGDISGPLKALYDAFERLWSLFGRYMPLAFYESIIDTRKNITERAERMAVIPEPEEEGDDDDLSDDSIDSVIEHAERYSDF